MSEPRKPLWLSGDRLNVQYVKMPLATLLARYSKTLPPVFDALRRSLPPGVVIAGGYLMELLAGLRLGDIDCWLVSDGAAAFRAKMEELLTKEPFSQFAFKEVAYGNSYSYVAPQRHVPISLNSFFVFDDAAHVVDNFDFTVCQLAIDTSDPDTVVLGATTLADLDARRLVIHRPLTTLYARAKRYVLDKGFQPSEESWETIRERAPVLSNEYQMLKALDGSKRSAQQAEAAHPTLGRRAT